MKIQNIDGDPDDDFQLPCIWLNEGRSPLVILKGFAELYLDDKSGDLNFKQRKMMQKIDDCTKDVIENWNEFQSFFRIGFQYNQSLSADALTLDNVLFLHENVINRALSSLMTIKEQIEYLLKDMLGGISDEDKEALDAMHTSCLYAIEHWNEPLDYFRDRGLIK